MYSYLSVPRGDTGYFFNTAYLPEGALNKGNYIVILKSLS